MRLLPILALLTLLGCSVPVANGWKLDVSSGGWTGEVVTWGFTPKYPYNPDSVGLPNGPSKTECVEKNVFCTVPPKDGSPLPDNVSADDLCQCE